MKESAKETLGIVTLYQKESKRLNDLRDKYKDVALAQGETSKEAKELQKEIEELDGKLKGIDANVGQYQRGVGGYAEALEEVGGASGVAVNGIKSVGATMKALLANPIVLFIAAIVAGLKLLFDGFKRTALGGELLAKAGGFLDGIFSSLIGLTDKLVKGIIKVFDDPLGSLKEFGNFLLENIINRFQAIPMLVQLAGKAFSQLIKRDFEGLKKTAKEAGTALIQLQTGLDEKQQNELGKAISGVTKKVKDNANAFAALAEARRRVRRGNRELEISIENLITQEEKLNAIRDDQTRGFKEREAAAELSREALAKRSEEQIKLAQNNLDLINLEVELRRRNGEEIGDLLDSQLEAQKTLISAEREFTIAVIENEKERAQVRQDRLERDLDFAIDAFDAQKSRNERLIADGKRAFEERKRIFLETARLADQSFGRQEEIINDLSNAQVDLNELLKLDAIALTERVRSLEQSEVVEGRTLEVIRERITVLQDLEDIQRELNEEELERQKRVDEVTQFELDRVVARKKIESEVGAFRLKAINERITAEIEAEKFRVKTLLNDETLLAEEKERIRMESEDRITEIQREGARDRIELLEEEASKFVQFGTALGDLFGSLSDRRSQKEDERLERLEEQKDNELELAGENAEEKARIEKAFDKQKERIEERQARRARKIAIFEKALAVSQALIDTGAAVVKNLRKGIPDAIAVGVFGALKTAAIAAQPIPAFAKGTTSAPGGLAIVGEKGRELIMEPSGKTYLSGNRAQLIDLPEGSQVLTNAATENILRSKERNQDSSNGIQRVIHEEKRAVMGNEMRMFFQKENDGLINAFEKGISKIEVHKWMVSNGELQDMMTIGNTKYQNWKSKNE